MEPRRVRLEFLLALFALLPCAGMLAGPAHAAAAAAPGASPASAPDELPAEAETDSEADLRRLAQSSLEQLMQIKVFAVTGTPQPRLSSPASVYVISGDDIRRSGHRSIAEALRMVPGMFVGRINSSSWVVGSRGLTGSSVTSTRYLVLIDGRQVYDPLTSTTFWDVVDTPLADIDRIEVIRGPGATLWGANAMNGVVNIVTKSALDTKGDLIQLGVGDLAQTDAVFRHGDGFGGDGAYRVWAKYGRRGDFEIDGASVHDQWSRLAAGFRVDKPLSGLTVLTLIGEAYTHPTQMESVLLPVPGADRQTVRASGDASVDGGSLLLRLNHGFGTPQGWRLRAYYDRSSRDDLRFGVNRETTDLDLRVWQHWGEHQDLMYGAEYLWTRDRTRDSGPVLFFDPVDRSWYQFNAFVQNTSELVPDRLSLMLGSKFTYHSFVGFGAQPSARLWWTPSEQQTVWAAVSRPIRMPSRFEEDGRLVLGYADLGALLGGAPNGTIIPLQVTGGDSLRYEKMTAWELGWRLQPNPRWLFETSLFFNDYDRLIEPAATILGAFTDAGSGRTWGAEANVSAQVTDAWRIEAGYSWLRVAIDGPVYQFEERSSPRTMAQLRSYLDLGDRVEMDGALYHVDSIAQLGVPAYTRLDLGLSLLASERTRVSLWGQNLLHAGHREASGAMVPRNVQLQMSIDLGH